MGIFRDSFKHFQDELKLGRIGISVYSSLYMHAVIPYLNLSSCFTGIEVDSFISLMVLPLLLPDARSKADANKVIYFTEVNLNALLFGTQQMA